MTDGIKCMDDAVELLNGCTDEDDACARLNASPLSQEGYCISVVWRYLSRELARVSALDKIKQEDPE